MSYYARAKHQCCLWAFEGISEHNRIDNECCPDFSCCEPELFVADRERRIANYYEEYPEEQRPKG